MKDSKETSGTTVPPVEVNAIVMPTPHLWEIDHPYYCNEGNYFSNGCEDNFKSLADFLDEYGNSDMDMNLVFRFDWVERDSETEEPNYNGDDNYRNGLLKIFWMGQRKGYYHWSLVEVCRADEQAVIEFLRPRWEHMRLLWAPLAQRQNSADPATGPAGSTARIPGPMEGFVMPDFEREFRYLVMKFKDVRKYLTDTEKEILFTLSKKISKGRCDDEKDQLACVVVESDWPEYEPTWKAIEERMAHANMCAYCGVPVDLPPGPQPVPPIICGGDDCRKKWAARMQQVG